MSDSSEKARPGPGRTGRVVLPIVSFLLMFGLAELVLQLFAPLPYSSRLYWIDDGHVKARLQPGQYSF